MWFRADLRVADNPAFYAAMSSGPTIAVYTLCTGAWRNHRLSPAKIALIIAQVRCLQDALAKLHVPLRVLSCNHFEQVPGALAEFSNTLPISALFFNHEFEINERLMSKAVIRDLGEQFPIQTFNDQCAIAPGRIMTGSGDWYKVFTPFKKRYLAEFPRLARQEYPVPGPQTPVEVDSDLTALTEVHSDTRWLELWPAGEDQAQQRLTRFAAEAMPAYDSLRDIPSADATSCLSPYLAVGALSSRQCMEVALRLGGIENPGPSTWLSELIWRDFYRHLLYAYPALCKFKPFQENTDRLPWKQDTHLLAAWQSGETGYPIVDAAMKQLRDTGWMHNRLRMVTAMFLTKHLFVDWRLGEDFFMQHLVDGDLASNNGGWQWSASTGVDAAPYFRIFNPTRQSERFDPDGTFIRRYLPNLARLNNKAIHAPSVEQAKACGYPPPIVDHATAVAQTKAWFQNLL